MHSRSHSRVYIVVLLVTLLIYSLNLASFLKFGKSTIQNKTVVLIDYHHLNCPSSNCDTTSLATSNVKIVF
jgi:hypothetical protein